MTRKFKQNMAKVREAIERDLDEGLKKAALVLQAESQKRAPVDTGALRASAFTRRVGGDKPNQVVYQVGYTQAYGIYVHEMVGSTFKVGEPKFLEGPAREMAQELGGVVRKAMKGGG